MEGRLIWKQSRPSFFQVETMVGNNRTLYENDPIFNVLLQTTIDRDVWPVPHLTSDGDKLAVAILAAKTSGPTASIVLKGP